MMLRLDTYFPELSLRRLAFFHVDGDGPSFVLEIRNIGSLISYFATKSRQVENIQQNIRIYLWMKLHGHNAKRFG